MKPIFSRHIEQDDALVFFYAICLALAGLGHGRDIFLNGWLPYQFAPTAFNLYWTTLAIADLLAAILLIAHLRIGVVLLVAIMISDVGVNLYATYVEHYLAGGLSLFSQVIFMLLVLVGVPRLWSGFNRGKSLNVICDIDKH